MWMECMGMISKRWVWVEFMGVASGCVCKEAYRLPHVYPYSSCVYPFWQQHP